jgi:signal peptidase
VRRALGLTWAAMQAVLLALLVVVIVLLALPHISSYDVFVVKGGSMEPAIHLGSVVVVDRSDRMPQVGAVVTFHSPLEGVVTHRVVAVGRSSFETQGDANNSVDLTPRSFSDVIGTVRLSLPVLGYALYVLQQPIVFFMVLIATLGALILGQVRDIGDEVRRIRGRRAGALPSDGTEPSPDA